jgi:hypothetical protein
MKKKKKKNHPKGKGKGKKKCAWQKLYRMLLSSTMSHSMVAGLHIGNALAALIIGLILLIVGPSCPRRCTSLSALSGFFSAFFSSPSASER